METDYGGGGRALEVSGSWGQSIRGPTYLYLGTPARPSLRYSSNLAFSSYGFPAR